MLRTTRRVPRPLSSPPTTLTHHRLRTFHSITPAAAAAEPQKKREGDISDSFATLCGAKDQPLPDEFKLLKLSLVEGREEKIKRSWERLLEQLKAENEIVARQGSEVIPKIRFAHLEEDLRNARDAIQKRGVAVVQGVIPQDEARRYKFELEEYIRKNPQTKGFPPSNPQVWELYWSAPQLRARLHPNLIQTQKALMQTLWHTTSPPFPFSSSSHSSSSSSISLTNPLTYADRLRIRHPNDTSFALGPHQDGGSVERWHPAGYGHPQAGTYNAVFSGDWDAAGGAGGYSPWDASHRIHAVTDLHNGLGACSAFRMFQGWLSLSSVGPREGTLLVNPLLKLSTVYALLRPFFRPRTELSVGREKEGERSRFLDAANWVFTAGPSMTSELHGATPGYGMEFPCWGALHHPHLELERTMVHVPRVRPGDFVVWHCDTIHAVDSQHKGSSDSSALYIPVCPATEHNAKYVARMRTAWRNGTPGPDFPGGKGESEHVDRPDEHFVRSVASADGLASFGLEPLAERVDGHEGEREAVQRINRILGF